MLISNVFTYGCFALAFNVAAKARCFSTTRLLLLKGFPVSLIQSRFLLLGRLLDIIIASTVTASILTIHT